MLNEFWFDFVMWRRRSAFFEWLMGFALLILAGILLRSLGEERHAEIPMSEITANVYLAASGIDLKSGESLYRDMASSKSNQCKSRKAAGDRL